MENHRGTVRFSGRPHFFVAFGVKKWEKREKREKIERERGKKIRVRQAARQSNRPGINDVAWNNEGRSKGERGRL